MVPSLRGAPPLNTITLGGKVSTCELWRDTHSKHSRYCVRTRTQHVVVLMGNGYYSKGIHNKISNNNKGTGGIGRNPCPGLRSLPSMRKHTAHPPVSSGEECRGVECLSLRKPRREVFVGGKSCGRPLPRSYYNDRIPQGKQIPQIILFVQQLKHSKTSLTS